MQSVVPQGYVLHPLLFLEYINDLNGCIKQLSTLGYNGAKVRAILPSFADDTQLTMAEKTEAALKNNMKKVIMKSGRWMRVNKLLVNNKKIMFMLYGRSANYCPLDCPFGYASIRKWKHKTNKCCEVSRCNSQ